jgi:hypothetical protein
MYIRIPRLEFSDMTSSFNSTVTPSAGTIMDPKLEYFRFSLDLKVRGVWGVGVFHTFVKLRISYFFNLSSIHVGYSKRYIQDE